MAKYLVYDINWSDVMYECDSLEEAQRYKLDWMDSEMEFTVRDLVIYSLVVEEI